MIQIVSGAGYWLHLQSNRELHTATVLLFASPVHGSIRASQLSSLTVRFFSVRPDRLTGLITLQEQRFFETARFQPEHSMRVFGADQPLAARMAELCATREKGGFAFRLKLLGLFVEVFAAELKREPPGVRTVSDARERLSEFLNQTPASELLQVSFSDLVEITRCTPRHLSRIFREAVGMSYRDKRAELRLGRARELLATTESKVVDVALESGYQSLSLFNQMFTRRFGMSPGKWRRKHQGTKSLSTRQRRKALLALS